MEDKENRIEETTTENLNNKLGSYLGSIEIFLSILETSSVNNKRKTGDPMKFKVINV